jgi:hypothetical protein
LFKINVGSIKALANKGMDIMLKVSSIKIKKFITKINLNFLNSFTEKIVDNFFSIKNIIFGYYWKILKL